MRALLAERDAALAKMEPRPHQKSVSVDELATTEREALSGLMAAEISKLEKDQP